MGITLRHQWQGSMYYCSGNMISVGKGSAPGKGLRTHLYVHWDIKFGI